MVGESYRPSQILHLLTVSSKLTASKFNQLKELPTTDCILGAWLPTKDNSAEHKQASRNTSDNTLSAIAVQLGKLR